MVTYNHEMFEGAWMVGDVGDVGSRAAQKKMLFHPGEKKGKNASW